MIATAASNHQPDNIDRVATGSTGTGAIAVVGAASTSDRLRPGMTAVR